MRKYFILSLLGLLLLLSGCNYVYGQGNTYTEKTIEAFDHAIAEQIITEHEQKIVELSKQDTISKEDFLLYREDISKIMGDDFGFEIANSFYDVGDIENESVKELTRVARIVYPSLADGNAKLDSADIVE